MEEEKDEKHKRSKKRVKKNGKRLQALEEEK